MSHSKFLLYFGVLIALGLTLNPAYGVSAEIYGTDILCQNAYYNQMPQVIYQMQSRNIDGSVNIKHTLKLPETSYSWKDSQTPDPKDKDAEGVNILFLASTELSPKSEFFLESGMASEMLSRKSLSFKMGEETLWTGILFCRQANVSLSNNDDELLNEELADFFLDNIFPTNFLEASADRSYPPMVHLGLSETTVRSGDSVEVTVVGVDDDAVSAIWWNADIFFGDPAFALGTSYVRSNPHAEFPNMPVSNSPSCDKQKYCSHSWTITPVNPGPNMMKIKICGGAMDYDWSVTSSICLNGCGSSVIRGTELGDDCKVINVKPALP